MRVLLGVERALDIVQTPRKPPRRTGAYARTYSSTTPRFVQSLDDKGVHSIEALDEMQEGGTVIIRSMGVAPEIYQQAENKGLTVVDCDLPTCQLVQNKAKQLVNEGYHLVIFGNLNTLKHRIWVSGRKARSSRTTDVRTAKLPKKVGVVVQTTQETELVSELLSHLALAVKRSRCSTRSATDHHRTPRCRARTGARGAVMIVVCGKKQLQYTSSRRCVRRGRSDNVPH